MSGRESKIQIRRTLNYFFNEGFDVAGRPVVKKSDITSDTEGRITPTLLADGKIHMIVDVKVGSFTFTSDSGLPEQTQRESTTEIVVSEGDTLVIGGLRQQEMVQTVSKVPLLGDLPILGWLFKHEQREIKQSVLTLFITPHVLREGQPLPPWPEVDLKNGHRIPSSDLNQVKL
jgi:type II secretory pathway component GspD/PulD (secretin)